MRCRDRLAAGCLACWAILVAGACSDCERSGCDAMTVRATEDGVSGVAGAVAYADDMATEDCTECGFSSATLRLWQTSSVGVTAEEAQLVVAQAPAFTLMADGHYRQELAPGSWLICLESRDCVAVEVREGATTTVNVKTKKGLPDYYVAESADVRPKRVDGLSVPR